MNKVQLYIQGERVNFFDDQDISVTQAIQDIKDPAKIFTDFSKTFNLPASKTNNKIFKHFYNYDIVNGFDSRKKVSAEIKLNLVTFKKGFIKLESVKLKDNAPYSYNVTFFGETVILKDVLGENKLSSLVWLNNFLLDYSSTEVKAVLQNGKDYTFGGNTYTDAIVAPLITHTNRLFYDTTGTLADQINNVYYDASEYTGVLWSDLKYSLRLHLIILAIQEQYPEIVFSDDFFNVENPTYYNLYMWMHRKKGDVQSTVTGEEVYSKTITGFSPTFFNMDITASSNSIFVRQSGSGLTGNVTFNTSDPEAYTIKILFNGSPIFTLVNVTGVQVANFSMSSSGTYSILVESAFDVNFNNIQWEVLGGASYYSTSTTNQQIPIIFTFDPTQQLPEITIIDFLTGIFKMFNLTAFVQDGIIKVDTLDNFYLDFNYYDITEYMDVEQSEVKNGLPYKQVDFVYADYKPYLASIFNQLNNEQFGELKYTGEDAGNWVGDIYKVQLPFQKMLYERFTNTMIQYGWMADDNSEPYIGKPLIHYVNQQTSATPLAFRDNNVDAHSSLTTYYIPLNSNGLDATGQSLNFAVEIDEYALTENTNTLFANYYVNYIKDIFNPKRRIIELTSFLPLKILLKYKLKDRFIINGKAFKINFIKTNLQTGKSKLELLNEL